jgi:integrase
MLTELLCKAKQHKDETGNIRQPPYKLSDVKGMYLLVQPTGGKLWRYDYRFEGKRKTLALGSYPEISLSDARERHAEARKLLANGTDPGENKKAQKAAKADSAANSFEVVGREWFARHMANKSESHKSKVKRRLEKDVFPWIGNRPIAEIKAPELLAVARRTESRGSLDTAHRVLQNCGQIFRYAVATGRADRDPSQDLKGALSSAPQSNFASITEPAKVAELLRAIDGFKGTFPVKCALLLAPMLFVRPGELRKAKWVDFDLDNASWRYFVTKTKIDHLVPLSRQAVAILKELHALTGHGQYVFPGGRDPRQCMSDAAINAALRRMGYDTKTEITGHGFRAMARTILHEQLGVEPAVIEHQLAHKVPDALGTAYNRTKFLQQRTAMMQTWADYLDELKAGAKIIQLHGSAA